MKFMKLLFLWVAHSGSGLASDIARPKPHAPGWPTADYTTFAALVAKAEMAIFDFGNGKKAFVRDREWLAAFQQQLVSTTGKHDAYCFCVAYPIVRLVSGEKELVAIELTHDNKVRFFAPGSSGDFIIPPADHETLRKLERAAVPAAIGFPKLPPPHRRPPPARIELKP
jgi:hypothetical protein